MTDSSAFQKFEPFLDLRLFKRCRRVVIQCPNSPSADELAAAFGLYEFFKADHRQAAIVHWAGQEPCPPNLAEMISLLGIPLERAGGLAGGEDLLIMVNCGPGDPVDPHLGAKKICVIGNRRPPGLLPEFSDVRPYLSAVSTLVWKLLEEAGHTPGRLAATALLYGLHSATGAFREIRFPLDLDLRDALSPPRADRWIFDKLTRANLSPEALKATAKALDSLEYHAEDRFVLINILPGDGGVADFIGEMAMRVGGLDAAVVFSEARSEISFTIRAISRELNVPDLAAWLTEGLDGSFGGNREQATGRFKPGGEFDRAGSGLEFFLQRLRAYFQAHEVIDCALITKPDHRRMRAYQKRPVRQGYLPSVKLAAPGAPLLIRMLEGDIDVLTSEDTYLLIGLRGEVYPIMEKTFRRAYKPVEEAPPGDFVYQPMVINQASGEKIMIGPLAGCCRSQETRVLARQLENRVKLFSKWDERSYLCGGPGDWLVQRREDPGDLYIVTRELFPLLYEQVNQEKASGKSNPNPARSRDEEAS